MRHILFEQSDSYPIALLVKSFAFNRQAIVDNYIHHLTDQGILLQDVSAFTLEYETRDKVSVKFIKEYLNELLPTLNELGTQYLYVADANYFKVLAGVSKADPHLGYVMPCKIKDFEHLHVVLGLNHQALIHDPGKRSKLQMGLDALVSHAKGTYEPIGANIIHSFRKPVGSTEIKEWLDELLEAPVLTADIEAFSLKFFTAGVGTISFATDKNNGGSFRVDYNNDLQEPSNNTSRFLVNSVVRSLLRSFFENYKGKLIWHNAPYDLKCLIYALWMQHPQDYVGMHYGLEVMTRNMEDTKIIAYLATNSCAGNQLGLKTLAHPFAGNWAVEEIKDITLIEESKLLQYNLVDALSTWFVYDTYKPKMIEDHQETIYQDLMLPSLKTIIYMEMIGMPMSPTRIIEVKDQLDEISNRNKAIIDNHPVVQELNLLLQENAMIAANAKLKTKQHPLEHFKDVAFNPNSPLQLQKLLHEILVLPVLDKTKTGQPATDADTLAKLINYCKTDSSKELLVAIQEFSKVATILSTFIPAFEEGVVKADGTKYLHGNFNLGGTVSGRLSSSEPNLQNIPANSQYGKIIKSAFVSPNGWLFCGADYSSLEDRINALLTKDPNKLKVYTDGFDGHCLRAYYYFRELMPDIVDTLESINSIEKLYKHLRQESKTPTFALTYQGTWMTLKKNLGWTEEKAKQVEARYHELYAASTQWVNERIQEASKVGYAEVAFGLRIRAPMLARTYLNKSFTPKEAAAEARTLGNALSGQSYGLLNSRAMNKVMEKVWASKYKYDILPVAQIHDAGYYLIRDDSEVVAFANQAITEAMSWQDLPEIQHDEVKLFANLDLFYPNWSNGITLPATATEQEIIEICKNAN